MKNYIILDSKTGTYLWYLDTQRMDIGDYLEIKFTGEHEAENKVLGDHPIVKMSYKVEVHFSAVHNEDNILETEFVSCSKFVNKFLDRYIKHITNRIIPMSVDRVITRSWAYWWPKINGRSIDKYRCSY